MSEKKFSKEEAIRFGWQRMKDNLGFFIVYFIIVLVIQIFFNTFAQLFLNKLPLLSILFSIGSLLISLIVSLFYIKIGLRLYENEKIGSYDFLSFSVSLLVKFFLGYLLYIFIVLIGLLFWVIVSEFTILKNHTGIIFLGILVFLILGIYLTIKYQFVFYLLADKGTGVIEAFTKSAKMTDGQKWNLFLLILLYILILFVGLLALGVGLLVAAPIVMIAQAYVYKKLCLNAVAQSDILVTNTGSIDNAFQTPNSSS